jgi:glutamate synthase (NADPH/NADH) large chain
MSGGMAYVYDPANLCKERVNQDMVLFQRIQVDHYADELRSLLTRHFNHTQSRFAERLLADFEREVKEFYQIVPREMLDKLAMPVTPEAEAAVQA